MIDLDNLARLVAGWGGKFFYDGELNDLAFVARGDEDMADRAVSLATMTGDVDDAGEPLATMLNALPALLAYARRVEGERDELVDAVVTGPLHGKTANDTIIALRGEVAELAAMCDAESLMLTQVGRERDAARVDAAGAIEAAAQYRAEMRAARAECERLRGLVVEACSMFYGAAGCIDPRDEAAASACHEAGHRVEAIRNEAAGE